ncbi:DMT family transporter [Phormidium tenue FACHB-886]|nr:DMT family transporter [Phormidium tenue FACHB-886]
MISGLKTNHSQGVLLLIFTTLVWGTSFPTLKHLMGDLSAPTILAMRFTVAALAFAPWLRSLNSKLIRDGVLLGSLYFAECTLALIGLETISANRSAFVVSLNVILVPIFAVGLGRRLPWQVLAAAGVAIVGISILSWEGGGLQIGDWLTIGCAIGVALYILLLEKVAPRHATLPLVAVQLTTMTSLSLLWAAPQLAAQAGAIAQHLPVLLYIGLVVTATPIWTQAIAQRWVAAHETALLYTLEPVFAAVFSFWLLGEQLGMWGLLGAALILGATVWSQRRG